MSVESLKFKEKYDFSDLREIVEILRSPIGCPWDRAQTHDSVRNCFLEEVYEAVDALDHKDLVGIREELGDVLFQVAFHARIEEEFGNFDLSDICDEVCRKMVIRHPHVFGEQVKDQYGNALKDWEAIKEKTHERTTAYSALDAIPRALPALMRAEKLGKKSRKFGFDWKDTEDAMQKVDEEFAELREALSCGDGDAIKEEFGDLFLALASAARLSGICAEEALNAANEKYLSRFSSVERQCTENEKNIDKAGRDTLLLYWKNAKKEEKNTEK